MGLARARAEEAGLRVLYATADEIEASVPFAGARVLLGRAARDVAPDGPARLGVLALEGALPDPSGPGSRSDEVVHALWWLIVELADEQPLALFLDDAQWADELTLGLLRLAARRAAELPLALVVAARPAAAGQRHAVLAAERAFVRLEPAPLSAAGTARLVEAMLGRPGSVALVARARAATRGNPLYLRELLAHAAGDALDDGRSPPQLVRLVADRLERLTPGRDLTRARGRGAGSRRRRGAGARARRARAVRGDRRRGGAARRARARRARVRLHPPGRRGGGARGDRTGGRRRAACARGRAARRRGSGRPARRRAPDARAAAR